MSRLEVTVTSAVAMELLGEQLAPLLGGGEVVLLLGDLGAGKTTFTKGVARGLGVVGTVRSPTFAMVTHHRARRGVRELVHVDLYRTTSVAEVEDLCLHEFVGPDTVALVEWAERAEGTLVGVVGSVAIATASATTRSVVLDGVLAERALAAGVGS